MADARPLTEDTTDALPARQQAEAAPQHVDVDRDLGPASTAPFTYPNDERDREAGQHRVHIQAVRESKCIAEEHRVVEKQRVRGNRAAESPGGSRYRQGHDEQRAVVEEREAEIHLYRVLRYNVSMVRLDALLNSWKTVREDTALAVEEFPPAELDFKPTPDLDSFRQITTHILNAGNGLSGVLLEGEETLMGTEFRDKIKKYFAILPPDADSATLAAELRQSIEGPLAELAQTEPRSGTRRLSRAWTVPR